MTTVRTILLSKGNAVWSVAPDTIVFEAIKMMAEKNVGALLVLQNEKVVGIFSERDYARKIVLKGETSHSIAIKDVMTSSVLAVHPEQSLDECMALMTGKRVRHLPVVENERLIGLISIGDVVKAIISEHEYTIKQLENYITGSR
ncbi:MAG: CBS domain-containing protein [Ignavibacteriae bacterium]|nr:MAG: CBS domain-containing protein [Ignavibacteriota bacterium]